MTLSQPNMADILYYQQSGDEGVALGLTVLLFHISERTPENYLLNSSVSIKRLYDKYPLWSAFVLKRNPV